MSPCGCKKQKTPEPIRTPSSIRISENGNNGQKIQQPIITKEDADLIKKIGDKLKG